VKVTPAPSRWVLPGVLGLLIVFALLAATGCSQKWKPRDPRLPPVVPKVGTVVEGVASWYGPGYHGQRTSSGEVFDQNDLTAAHYEWAFGTRVRVTLLSTGKSAVVRINDRFPKFKGRVLDVSRATARAIGLIGPGTGTVRLEVVQ
jgi:rare lipoprotein A